MWVTISGGTFQMGSTSGQSNETPVHQVTVPAFQMTETEVTVAQYEVCVNEGGACSAPGTDIYCNWNDTGYEDHPVNCVDWQQAVDFCTWAGGRLPSEAEWEYAARSTGPSSSYEYPWGNATATCSYAVMEGGGYGCGTGRTWAVCSKPAGNTVQGLCDMAGNVYEWVQDWYHGDYTGAPTDGSAWLIPTGSERVMRGGSLYNVALHVRAANRYHDDPSYQNYYLGFRCARDAP
jgi:formylglycine-generating enzyme required for sulfatase activity